MTLAGYSSTDEASAAQGERARLCWVVTDGRAGNENPALGLAEAVARLTPLTISVKRIEGAGFPPGRFLRDAFARLAPFSFALPDPPFAGPSPALWIGCGRASAPLGASAKRRHAQSFVVQLLTPPVPSRAFDLVIPPSHDGLTDANVFSVTGSLSRATPARLKEEAAQLSGALAHLPRPRVAVLLGGANRAFKLDDSRMAAIAADLRALAETGAGLMIAPSRRTPPEFAVVVKEALKGCSYFVCGGEAVAGLDNPYYGVLGLADAVIVTEDSVNMTSEAAMTGKPVHVIALDRRPWGRGALKFERFHQALREHGAARAFAGRLESWSYAPLDETARAATEVVRRLHARR